MVLQEDSNTGRHECKRQTCPLTLSLTIYVYFFFIFIGTTCALIFQLTTVSFKNNFEANDKYPHYINKSSFVMGLLYPNNLEIANNGNKSFY